MDRIAARVLRGDVVESVHRASVAVADRRGRLVASFGDPKLVTYVRSTAKPFQAVPVVETGAADKLGLSPEELAIVCASHNGEDKHVRLVQGILERIGLGPEALQCGRHAPYHSATARGLGDSFTALHNNCSGKHAGMLATCVFKKWDTRTYLDPQHPLQQAILEVVAKETGQRREAIPIGVDGCSAPNFAMPLRASARAWARLADAETVPGRRGRTLQRLRDAMLAHPDVVAGEDRTDTKFMRAFAPRLVVKAGGEAFFSMAWRPGGLGIALKVEDGSTRPIPALLFRILDQLGAVGPTERAALVSWLLEPQKNWAGKTVGRLETDLTLRKRGIAQAIVRESTP